MKVAVQIVDFKSGVHQYGQIDEPVSVPNSVANALAHFGVKILDVNWDYQDEVKRVGVVDGTTKIVSVICSNL